MKRFARWLYIFMYCDEIDEVCEYMEIRVLEAELSKEPDPITIGQSDGALQTLHILGLIE